MSAEILRITPLHDAHVALGARMVPFAGYSMPVQYQSVIAEAKAVREGIGMFDVSHMARLIVTGAGTFSFLDSVSTNDLAKLVDGVGQYSMLTNEAGGVIDDIILYRVSHEEYRVVVNADNHAKDVAWLKSHQPSDVEMVDETDETAMIAVQGAAAVGLFPDLADLPMFGVRDTHFGGVRSFAARSGYTGEDGFELVCAASDAETLWNALIATGVTPCGLASRDTLRVEAGLPLYGHELNDETSPIESGVGWAVSKTKNFVGSEAVAKVRAEGVRKRVLGVRLETKRLLQPGMPVVLEGEKIGTVLSGVYSPLLDCGIGSAMIDAVFKEGTAVGIDIRGKLEPATLVNKRFYKRK